MERGKDERFAESDFQSFGDNGSGSMADDGIGVCGAHVSARNEFEAVCDGAAAADCGSGVEGSRKDGLTEGCLPRIREVNPS